MVLFFRNSVSDVLASILNTARDHPVSLRPDVVNRPQRSEPLPPFYVRLPRLSNREISIPGVFWQTITSDLLDRISNRASQKPLFSRPDVVNRPARSRPLRHPHTRPPRPSIPQPQVSVQHRDLSQESRVRQHDSRCPRNPDSIYIRIIIATASKCGRKD